MDREEETRSWEDEVCNITIIVRFFSTASCDWRLELLKSKDCKLDIFAAHERESRLCLEIFSNTIQRMGCDGMGTPE